MIKKSDSPMDGAYSSGVTPPRPPEGKHTNLKTTAEVLYSQLGHYERYSDWNIEIIESALYLVKKRAIEEAASVAETIYGTKFHDKVERRTGNKIAANIRALMGKGKKC